MPISPQPLPFPLLPPGTAPFLPYWYSRLTLPPLLPPPPHPSCARSTCFQSAGGPGNGSTKSKATQNTSLPCDQRQKHQHVLLSGCRPDSSSVLQEFRRCQLQLELEDIRYYVLEFAKDQYGSRFIQQQLECANSGEKQAVFDELVPELRSLMNHKYANYVIQKYFEFGSDEQKIVLVQHLQGNVLFLSFAVYGCRVIQKAIETLPPEFQVRPAITNIGPY